VPEITPDELKEMLEKLEDVCRQAQELQHQIRQKMADRARSTKDHPARSDAADGSKRR
jgi:hypothetical protein